MPKKKVTPKKPPGPTPESLKIEGDWKDAVKKVVKRGRPQNTDLSSLDRVKPRTPSDK